MSMYKNLSMYKNKKNIFMNVTVFSYGNIENK